MSLPKSFVDFARRFPVEHRLVSGTVPTAIVRNPQAPTASLLFAFRDGVAFEPLDSWGIAHFMEHILFRGTQKYPTLYDISRRAESVGGIVSAYSTRDMTAFWVKTPPGQDRLAVDLLVELLTRPTFLEEHLSSERVIIQQERQRELSTPSLVSSLILEGLLLVPDPTARHPVGRDEVIGRIDRSALNEYLRSVYHRNNMVVAMAGNLSDRAHDALQESLEAFPIGSPREKLRACLTCEAANHEVAVLPSHQKTQVHLSLGWKFPIAHPDERLAWLVANTLLGAGYTSLLNWMLRERENITYLCTTKLNMYGDLGVFKINLALKDQNLARAIDLIDNLISEVGAGTIPDGLFDEAVIRQASSVIGRLEDSLDTARLLGQSLIGTPTPFSFEGHLERLRSVECSEVSRLIRTHLARAKRKIVVQTGSEEVAKVFPDAVVLKRNEDGEVALFQTLSETRTTA